MLKSINKRMNSKGFTLIELLVVIAIIGILSSVVLVSLNSARNKAKDTAVKAALAEARAEGEMWYDDHTSVYTGYCAGDFVAIKTNVEANNGGVAVVCNAAATEWAASSVLPSDPTNKWWCVDSTGASEEIAASLVAQTVCP